MSYRRDLENIFDELNKEHKDKIKKLEKEVIEGHKLIYNLERQKKTNQNKSSNKEIELRQKIIRARCEIEKKQKELEKLEADE